MPRTPPRSERAQRRPVAPPIVLAAIALAVFVPTAIWAAGIAGFTIMADELGYLKQAVQIADTGTLVRAGDFYFNSYLQLLPLLSAPFLAHGYVPDAVRLVHVVYAAVLATTVVPVYLLARAIGL